VQGGFLASHTILKNERGEQQPPRLTMKEALAKLREFTGTDGHSFVSDDAPFTDLDCVQLQGHRRGRTRTSSTSLANMASLWPRSKANGPISTILLHQFVRGKVINPERSSAHNTSSAPHPQHRRARGNCGAGGEHVVNQQHSPAGNRIRMADREGLATLSRRARESMPARWRSV